MTLRRGNYKIVCVLIGLASPENTVQCQACVANILMPICQNANDQKMLCQTGVIPLLARLMTTRYTILQIPALKCLAAMCFTNRAVSDIVCITKWVRATNITSHPVISDFHSTFRSISQLRRPPHSRSASVADIQGAHTGNSNSCRTLSDIHTSIGLTLSHRRTNCI